MQGTILTIVLFFVALAIWEVLYRLRHRGSVRNSCAACDKQFTPGQEVYIKTVERSKHAQDQYLWVYGRVADRLLNYTNRYEKQIYHDEIYQTILLPSNSNNVGSWIFKRIHWSLLCPSCYEKEIKKTVPFIPVAIIGVLIAFFFMFGIFIIPWIIN